MQCLASITAILPELEGDLPYDEADMAIQAQSPSHEEETAARKLWMRLMRMLNPDRSRSVEHAALCNGVFRALNELSRR